MALERFVVSVCAAAYFHPSLPPVGGKRSNVHVVLYLSPLITSTRVIIVLPTRARQDRLIILSEYRPIRPHVPRRRDYR